MATHSTGYGPRHFVAINFYLQFAPQGSYYSLYSTTHCTQHYYYSLYSTTHCTQYYYYSLTTHTVSLAVHGITHCTVLLTHIHTPIRYQGSLSQCFIHTPTHTQTYIHKHIGTHTSTPTGTHASTHTGHTHRHTYWCTYWCTHQHTHTQTTTAPYSFFHNGKSERTWRTIMDTVRCLLKD